MTNLEIYWDLIKRREIVVGYWIRKEIQNLINDLDDPRYIYDTTESDKRIKFKENLCFQSKAPYYMKPLILMPHQKAFWEALYSFHMADTGLRRFVEALMEIARKNGKDLDENTRIPTPKGDRILKDIQVGDYVYGISGKPVKVLGTKCFDDQVCYEVTFEDGEKIVCGAGHLWLVKDKNSDRRFLNGTIDSPFYQIETHNLIGKTGKKRKDNKGFEYFYRVPIPSALEHNEADLPLKPYTLGVWLGDGAKNTPYITCGEEDIKELTANIRADGYLVTAKKYGSAYRVNVSLQKRKTILPIIHKLGIFEKRIPECYFNSSVQQRYELLKGLMDTDGHVSKKGECEWVQKSPILAKDFSRLLTSLGIKHNVSEKAAKCSGTNCGLVYRVLFYVDRYHSCFKFGRKHERLKEKLNKRMLSKSIINIEKVPTVKTKCLTVEGGLFICGEKNTITHNSTDFAADGNYDLFMGEGGNDICCASNDDRQARLIWSEIGGMRGRLDPKKALTSQNLTEIRNRAKNITVFRLSSKTRNKDGFNISKTFLDESHDIAEEEGQSEIAEACWRGMSSKEEPLFLNCTTQGFNRGCYLDKKIEYAKRVIRGEIDDIQFLPFLFEQDSEAEIWQDESSWEKSNPAIRYGVKKIAKLRRDVEAAKYDKATRIHLLTKDFNIPQANAQTWLMLEDYDYPVIMPELSEIRGSYTLGAVDLSATTDLTSAKALVMLPAVKKKIVLSHYWIPESKLQDSNDKEAGATYSEWARDGYLTICEGNEVDLVDVADWFYRLYDDLKLLPYKIGYDQRFSKVFCDRCTEYGFDTERLDQGRALSTAMKLTEAELKSRNILYNNPMDKWCLSNCCCKVDSLGNIQPVKIPGQASKRIDGAVTLIMLNEMYRRYKAEYKTLIGSD